MWKWVRKFFIAFFGVLTVFFAYVAFQPADFKVTRNAEINASPEEIFAHVNSAEELMKWSPWLSLDPDADLEYSGPKEGVGSKVHWRGDENLGEGTLEIVESAPNEYVTVKLEFLWPSQVTNTSEIFLRSLSSKENTTDVEWNMSGKNNFMGRLAFVMYDMDMLIGQPFETGLDSLKTLVEKENTEE